MSWNLTELNAALWLTCCLIRHVIGNELTKFLHVTAFIRIDFISHNQ